MTEHDAHEAAEFSVSSYVFINRTTTDETPTQRKISINLLMNGALGYL